MSLDLSAPTYEFAAYTVGLCYASVCTRLNAEQTTGRLNAEHPTGLARGWAISADERFASGQPNPSPCNKHPGTHRHVLYEC